MRQRMGLSLLWSILHSNTLKESMVCGWKKDYLLVLARKKKNGEDLNVKALPTAKMGRPLNLGAELDK